MRFCGQRANPEGPAHASGFEKCQHDISLDWHNHFDKYIFPYIVRQIVSTVIYVKDCIFPKKRAKYIQAIANLMRVVLSH